MCSCQAALIHRSLKTQEFGLTLALAPTKPQLDSGILHNIPIKSHVKKHIHMPTHRQTQMVRGQNRIVQQNRSNRKITDILPYVLMSTSE